MKHLFILISLFTSLVVTGQVAITIEPTDTIVCFGDSVAVTTKITLAGTDTVTSYRWQKNFIDIPGATDSLYVIAHVKVSSPGLYRCIITVKGTNDTSNDAQLRMHPKMNIDTLYRYNDLGCRNDCKGQFKVRVSGGLQFKNYPPYMYEWNGGFSQDTIVFGLCRGNYHFVVKDSNECKIDTVYFVDALKSPKVDFEFLNKDSELLTEDTIFLTNPNVQVLFPDSMKIHMTNWTYDFSDSTKIPNLNPASHTYGTTGTYPVRLTFTDVNGCDTTITHDLVVKVAELEITKLLTPNGDDLNDQFKIKLKDFDEDKVDFSTAYLSNEFIVFDRWGKKVFDKKDIKSRDWDGGNLSDGTYFYILRCHGQYSDEVFRGSVTILHIK